LKAQEIELNHKAIVRNFLWEGMEILVPHNLNTISKIWLRITSKMINAMTTGWKKMILKVLTSNNRVTLCNLIVTKV